MLAQPWTWATTPLPANCWRRRHATATHGIKTRSANLYYLGLGGPRDQRAAANWYLESALQGNTDAQINVARHYVLGLGIAKDPMRAFAWLFHARSAGREVAEGDIKLLAGSAQITPTHLQRVRKL